MKTEILNFRKYITAVSIFIFFAAIVTGCGKKTETQTASDTTAVQQDKVKQQISDDANAPGSTGNTNTTPENELGMSAGLPPDFPSDVPQPKNGKVIGSLMSSDGMVVTFQTDVPVKEIVDFYKSEMSKSGFKQTESGDMLLKETGGMIGFQKDNRDIQLMLSSSENITSVVITYK